MYVCQECNSNFKDGSNLRRHKRALHTKEKPYKCQRCEKQFARSDHLKRHNDRHDKQPAKLLCGFDDCKRTFATEDKLEQHRELHKKKAQESVIYVKGRLVRKHIEDNKTLLKCPFEGCDKLYSSYPGIAKHIDWHDDDTKLGKQHNTKKYRNRPNENNKYHCKVCTKIFKNKRHAARYRATVHTTRNRINTDLDRHCSGFPCPYEHCNKIFSTPGAYKPEGNTDKLQAQIA